VWDDLIVRRYVDRQWRNLSHSKQSICDGADMKWNDVPLCAACVVNWLRPPAPLPRGPIMKDASTRSPHLPPVSRIIRFIIRPHTSERIATTQDDCWHASLCLCMIAWASSLQGRRRNAPVIPAQMAQKYHFVYVLFAPDWNNIQIISECQLLMIINLYKLQSILLELNTFCTLKK